MALTLTTPAAYQFGGTQSRRFNIQYAAGETAAASVTIAHLLGTWLVNTTIASQILKVNLSKHNTINSALAAWALLSYDTTNIIIARNDVAASVSNLEVEVMAAHSIIL